MKTPYSLALGLLLLLPAACDRHDADDLHEATVDIQEEVSAESPPAALAAAAGEATTAAERKKLHRKLAEAPVMPGAKASFDELQRLIDTKYVGGPLSEDELWTAAMEGVLARLIQLPEHDINALLDPRDHEDLVIGTKGRLVGIGVMIERVANVVVVRDVIPGGPADKAGLRGGDRILGVDGERLESLDLPAAVDRIRGEDGSTVELFVQRDTEEWDQTVTRGLVEVKSVQSRMLEGGIGLVRITSFSESTPEQLDAALAALDKEGMTGVVLDLRDCPGGLLDAALEVASRFVPPGKTLLTVEKRGGEEKVHVSEGEHPWQQTSVAVLIGPHTASGAEIVADAIAEHDRGLLVGEPTLGKHTIESIHELSEGWAVKLSVSRFATASGQAEQGTGVAPDIAIPGSPAAAKSFAPLAQVDPAADPPMATALGLLRND